MRQCYSWSAASIIVGLVIASNLAGCSNNPSGGLPVAVAAPEKAPKPAPIKAKAPTPKKATKIAWEKSFEIALKKAQATNKTIMLDFATKWCSWCKVLDSKTYTNAAVIQESQNFINVKIDAEEKANLAQRYNVSGFPTIVWTDSEGHKIDTLVGYATPVPFVAAMRAAYSKFQPYVTA